MKWTVKLVAEVGQGKALEREIATIERADQVSAASIGLTIAEGKSIMEGLQRELVTALWQALSQRNSHLHWLRRVLGQRNHCQADGEAPTDALE